MKQRSMCEDKSALVAYLYGECDEAERRLVEQHLAGCASCADEMEQLRGVRIALREWAPPEQALGFRIVREGEPAGVGRATKWGRPGGTSRWLPTVPAWAQLAAAVLVLAIGAAIANLDVRIGNGGVSIRTGWQRVGGGQQAQAPQPAAHDDKAPWRADLAAFERQVREQISTIQASAPSASTAAAPVPASALSRLSPEDRAALVRQVQPIIDGMGRRQQENFDRQLAQRFLRFARDVDSQRAADWRVIQQNLGQIDIRTTSEVADLRRMVRVANVQQMK